MTVRVRFRAFFSLCQYCFFNTCRCLGIYNFGSVYKMSFCALRTFFMRRGLYKPVKPGGTSAKRIDVTRWRQGNGETTII